MTGFANIGIGAALTTAGGLGGIHLPTNAGILNYKVYSADPSRSVIAEGSVAEVTPDNNLLIIDVPSDSPAPGEPSVNSVTLRYENDRTVAVVDGTGFQGPEELDRASVFFSIDGERFGPYFPLVVTESEIQFELPTDLVIGESTIQIARSYNTIQGAAAQVLSKPFSIRSAGGFAFVAKPVDGSVAVVHADRAAHNVPGEAPTTFKTIELSGLKPSSVTMSPDRKLLFALDQSSKMVSLIDPINLQELTGPQGRLRLKLPGKPHAIAVDPLGQYAYISDENKNSIYVIDVDFSSDSFLTKVRTINVGGGFVFGQVGLRGLAIDPTGRHLIVADPVNLRSDGYFGRTPDANGKLHVYDVSPHSKARWAHLQSLEAGNYPFAVRATGFADTIAVTNFLSDNQGVQIFQRDVGGEWSKLTDIRLVLGERQAISPGPISDSFDVNNARDVIITPDGKWGFVAGFNVPDPKNQVTLNPGIGVKFTGGGDPSKRHSYRFRSPHFAGSNVGIIQNPLSTNAKLVAATRPIPNSYVSSLALSSDGKYLHAAYPGVQFVPNVDEQEGGNEPTATASQRGALLVYDVDAIAESVVANAEITVAVPVLWGGPTAPILARHSINDVNDGQWSPEDPQTVNQSIDINAAFRPVAFTGDGFVNLEVYSEENSPLFLGGNAKSVAIDTDAGPQIRVFGQDNFNLENSSSADTDYATERIDVFDLGEIRRLTDAKLILEASVLAANVGNPFIEIKSILEKYFDVSTIELPVTNEPIFAAAEHLRHFLDNVGTPIHHPLGSRLSDLIAEDRAHVNNHLATTVAVSRLLDEQVANSSGTLTIDPYDFDKVNIVRPQFTLPDPFYAIGGTQGLQITGNARLVDGRYNGFLTYTYIDTYGYGQNDSEEFAWPDSFARDLQVHGLARPFTVTVTVMSPFDIKAKPQAPPPPPPALQEAGSIHSITPPPAHSVEAVDGAFTLRETLGGQLRSTHPIFLPAGATAIQFDVTQLNLVDDVVGPSDSFEVALIDDTTGQSVVSTISLSDTDALLNLQSDMTLYFGTEISIPNVSQSGQPSSLDGPFTVTIDLTAIDVDKAATLYFDLLGFGDAASSVAIDNLRLVNDSVVDVEFGLAAESDSGILGDGLTNQTVVRLEGSTAPGTALLLDVDGDGFDDGTATADSDGLFFFAEIVLAHGANSVRVEANNGDQRLLATQRIEVDSNRPYAQLSDPIAASLVSSERGYVDIQWTDEGLAGTDENSIDADDVTVGDVSIDRAEDLGGGRVRYWYNDDGETLGDGLIEVTFVAGQVADLAGNVNAGGIESFSFDASGPVAHLVSPAADSTISADPGYIDLAWSDIGPAGIDEATLGTDDLRITGVSVDAIETLADGVTRYWYNQDGETLPGGRIEVVVRENIAHDLAGNSNATASWGFTVQSNDSDSVDVTDKVNVQFTGIRYIGAFGSYLFFGTVENRSAEPLAGPLRMYFQNLTPADAVPVGASVDDEGVYFIDITDYTGDAALLPGEMTATIPLQLRMTPVPFHFDPIVTASVAAPPSAGLTLSASLLRPDQSIDVTLVGGPGNASDRIGLFAVGAADDAPMESLYLDGTPTEPADALTEAMLTFDVPDAEGSYEFRLLTAAGVAQTSPTFVVADSRQPVLLDVSRYEPLDAVTNSDELVFRVLLDQHVMNLSTLEFDVVGGTTAEVFAIEPVQGTGEALYQVTVAGGDLASFNGVVGLTLQSPAPPPVASFRVDGGLTMVGQFFQVDNIAPSVDGVNLDDGQHSVVRSLDLVFDSEVAIGETAFRLHDGAGREVMISQTLRIVDGKTIVSLSFSGDLVDESGSLIDGAYVLTALQSEIADLAGNLLSGRRDAEPERVVVDEFFRFFGDSDGDRDVDGQDYGRFGLSLFSRQGDERYDGRFDFDGDGDVDGQDYAQFGRRLLRTLPPNS
ncbi:YncE family protein [Stieleria maiorica]|uniref:YncE family protein n=1 Tax=Stieleria maiorica TaxID=2795974 RepID=UPI0011CA9AFB|nr:hypothetical protein [Stieleria maiorica]